MSTVIDTTTTQPATVNDADVKLAMAAQVPVEQIIQIERDQQQQPPGENAAPLNGEPSQQSSGQNIANLSDQQIVQLKEQLGLQKATRQRKQPTSTKPRKTQQASEQEKVSEEVKQDPIVTKEEPMVVIDTTTTTVIPRERKESDADKEEKVEQPVNKVREAKKDFWNQVVTKRTTKWQKRFKQRESIF